MRTDPHDFVHPSNLHVWRKHYGANVVFHTGTDATSLLNDDGTPDNAKIEALFKQFSDPTPEKHEIENALKDDIKHRLMESVRDTLLVEAGAGSLLLWELRRRRSLSPERRASRASDTRPYIAIGGALLAYAAGSPIIGATQYYFAANHHTEVVADPVFDGTAMQGWGVRGPFARAIDVGWHSWTKISDEKNAFYKAELANFEQGFKDKYGVEQLAKPAGIKRIMFIDDLQGMDGPTLIVGAAAKAYDVDVIVVGGDITQSGDLLETSVLDGLSEHAKGIPVFMSTGVHDTAQVIQAAREHHFTVADDNVQEVAGIPFLGAEDASVIKGMGLTKEDVTNGIGEDDVTSRIEDKASSMKQPVIVVAHDHHIGEAVAQANYTSVSEVLTGRYFYPPSPTDYGNTVLLPSGSTGGHTFGEGINLSGKIAGKAPFQIVDVDAKTLQFISVIEDVLDPIPSAGESTASASTNVVIGDPVTRAQLDANAPTNSQLLGHNLANDSQPNAQSRHQPLSLAHK